MRLSIFSFSSAFAFILFAFAQATFAAPYLCSPGQEIVIYDGNVVAEINMGSNGGGRVVEYTKDGKETVTDCDESTPPPPPELPESSKTLLQSDGGQRPPVASPPLTGAPDLRAYESEPMETERTHTGEEGPWTSPLEPDSALWQDPELEALKNLPWEVFKARTDTAVEEVRQSLEAANSKNAFEDETNRKIDEAIRGAQEYEAPPRSDKSFLDFLAPELTPEEKQVREEAYQQRFNPPPPYQKPDRFLEALQTGMQLTFDLVTGLSVATGLEQSLERVGEFLGTAIGYESISDQTRLEDSFAQIQSPQSPVQSSNAAAKGDRLAITRDLAQEFADMGLQGEGGLTTYDTASVPQATQATQGAPKSYGAPTSLEEAIRAETNPINRAVLNVIRWIRGLL